MTTPEFFFDTADADYIRDLADHLAPHIDFAWSLLGVTTNPNALSKIDCNSLTKLEKVIPELCKLVTELRGENIGGTVYVQMPNSHMTEDDVLEWAKYIADFTDGTTNVGLKIPHFTYALDMASELADQGVEINVTGIADWATLLKALSFPGVMWVSLISGRMEEVGIDANFHMEFIKLIPRDSSQGIIAGSMRTVRGLKDAILRGTVPTIGQRVWTELLLPNNEHGRSDLSGFPLLWNGKNIVHTAEDWGDSIWNILKSSTGHAPLVTGENERLSEAFFVQMNELGWPIYEEWINKHKVNHTKKQ